MKYKLVMSSDQTAFHIGNISTRETSKPNVAYAPYTRVNFTAEILLPIYKD